MDEAHRLIQAAGGGLGFGDGEENGAEIGIGFGEADEFGEEGLPCPLAAQARGDVHAPDVAFVATLFAGVAVVTGGAGEAGLVEGADDKIVVGGIGEAVSDGVDGGFQVLGGGFPEGFGDGREGLQAEVPEGGRVGGGEEADREHRLVWVVHSTGWGAISNMYFVTFGG